MRNTTRHISRRPPVRAQRALGPAASQHVAPGSNKVDTLRRLVAAGQYQVNPQYLAMKIFKAAGLD